MKRKNTLRLLVLFCTVVLPILQPSEVLAQRKLVPVKCNAEELELGWSCLDSLFVEEGTLPPDTCTTVWEFILSRRMSRVKWRLLFTNMLMKVTFRGQDVYAAEYDELSKSRGVIDSSNAYLLDEKVRTFLALLQEEVGFDQVVAHGVSPGLGFKGPRRFSFYIPRPKHYNYWKVYQLWALSHGADTTDSAAVESVQVGESLYLPFPCLQVVSSGDNDALSSAASSSTVVSHGAILLTGFKGRYSLYDINGRVVAQGELVHGEENRVLQMNPGVYVLQNGTKVRTIMVLP